MALIVQKFGGTSVGDIARMQHVADMIIATRKQGHDVVVVVSAMNGETDKLVALAREINPQPDPREYSALVSTGEQVTMALMSMILQQKGCAAQSYTGWQVKIQTDSCHHKARIMHIEDKHLRRSLQQGKVAVVAGFQGIDADNNITTLGRGGSDTTAVAIAAALKADECQIYTDVDGVYTCDPRMVPEARRLKQITFEEMLELASLGAKVLQIRSVEFAGKYKVPLRVLSTFKPGPGTLITFEENRVEEAAIAGIAFNRNEAKLTIRGIPDKPGIAFKIVGSISEAHIDIDMIVQNLAANGTTDLTFTVNRDDYAQALTVLQKIGKELGATEVRGDNKIAKLSLVGVGMRSHSGVASKMFATLGAENINIQLITTSEIKVSVVVDENNLERGVRALHAAFELEKDPEEEFDPVKSKHKEEVSKTGIQ